MNGHDQVRKICSDYIERYAFCSEKCTFEIYFSRSLEDETPVLKVVFNGVTNYSEERIDTPDSIDMLIGFEYSEGKCNIRTCICEFDFSYSGIPLFESLLLCPRNPDL
jgi:hypothetical protein